jgi:uncharacterized membrane protein (DUF106 family)
MGFFFNFVLWNPFVSILVFSFLITLGLTYLYKKLTNQNKVKELNEKQKQLKEQMKQFKDDPKKVMELQKEMLQGSAESMKMSFKPMIVSFIPIIIVLGLLEKLYQNAQIGTIVHLPVLGNLNWFWTYVVLSFIFSLVLKKLLKA